MPKVRIARNLSVQILVSKPVQGVCRPVWMHALQGLLEVRKSDAPLKQCL